jgi:hypothetical protein
MLHVLEGCTAMISTQAVLSPLQYYKRELIKYDREPTEREHI